MTCICATKKSLIKKFCCTAGRVALPEAYKDLLFKSLALRFDSKFLRFAVLESKTASQD